MKHYSPHKAQNQTPPVDIQTICEKNGWGYQPPKERPKKARSTSFKSVDWFEVCKRNGWDYEPPKPKKKNPRVRKSSYSGLGEESSLCGSTAILLECEKGTHDYAKRLYCNREWCLRCGEYGSDMHKRRYARLMPKVFYLGQAGKGHGLGYWVFTIPPYIRSCFRSKKALQKLGRFCRELLKEHGFSIGISRWHYFGDGSIDGDAKDRNIDLGEYHPHLNCVVPGRWIHDKEMETIKAEYRVYLSLVSGQPVDVVDVWYQYYKEDGQWWHKGTYITRPTFRSLDGHVELAKTLYGFRNVIYWGWGKKTERELKEEQGRNRLASWLDSLPPCDEFLDISSENAVALSLLTEYLCSECFLLGSRVHIQTKLDLDTASPVVVSVDSLSEYIEKDYGAGFLSLKPITQEVILKLKPMSLDPFDSPWSDTS